MLRILAIVLLLLPSVSFAQQDYYYYPQAVRGDVIFQFAVLVDPRVIETCVYRVDVQPEQVVSCVTPLEYREILPEDVTFTLLPDKTLSDYRIVEIVATVEVSVGPGPEQRFVARNIAQYPDGTIISSEDAADAAVVPTFIASPVLMPVAGIGNSAIWGP
jgi:hypothetical protein